MLEISKHSGIYTLKSVKEVKNLFETIKDAVVATKKPVNESKGFA